MHSMARHHIRLKHENVLALAGQCVPQCRGGKQGIVRAATQIRETVRLRV
jgi:hypothetical protein